MGINNSFKSSGVVDWIAFHAAQSQPVFGENIGVIGKVAYLIKRIFIAIADLFLRLSSSYRSLKNRYIQAANKTGFATLFSSLNCRSVLKIGLITAGVIATGVGLYYYANQSRSWKELTGLEQLELTESLSPLCREAVENYCKPGLNGESICLKDFLDPDWEAMVTTEYNTDVLCDVYLQSNNCSSLVGQPDVGMVNGWKPKFFTFIRNYENIPFPDRFSEEIRDIFQSFADQTGWVFKSHIFCRAKN